MQTWKKIILGFIAFLFMLTFPITLTWYSLSNSLLNADTYKPIVPLAIDSITKNISNDLGTNNQLQITPELLKSITPTINNWLDNIFNYINGTSSSLELNLPEDNVLKPLLMQVALTQLKNVPEANTLTQEQINTLFEQNYPQMKTELQTQLNNAQTQINTQLLELRNAISLAKLIGLIALILSILFVLIAILMIRQIRSIMNWIGTYFLLGATPLFIIGLVLLTGFQSILQTMNLPLEAITPLTTIINSVFINLVIFSGIFVVLGIALLIIKFAFKKEEIEPSK